MRNWKNIVSEKYFEFCEPDKVTFQKNKKNNGTVYIKCFNNVVSFYIENNKFFIIEKINAIFGYSLISNIKIKQDPKIIEKVKNKVKNINDKDQKVVENSIKNIQDSTLKDALASLGISIFYKK